MTEWDGGSLASNLDYTLRYEESKYLHECTHCGFEADLYESEYECPICKKGTLCRTAQNITFEGPWRFVLEGSLWSPRWTGYEPTTASGPSQPMEDGFWFGQEVVYG